MIAKLTFDKLGRIVLPKPVRDKHQPAAGDQLELESLDDRIVLRPLRGTAQLRKSTECGSFAPASHGRPQQSSKRSSRGGAKVTSRMWAKSLRALFDTSVPVPVFLSSLSSGPSHD